MKTLLLVLLLMSTIAFSASGPTTILIVGDSLSAAYGLAREVGWVNLLRARIASLELPLRVVNASISGDITAGGLARLPRALADHRPAILIIELGANDGLRGLSPAQTKKNLAKMIEQGQASGASVILMEMRLPPNFGKVFNEKFRKLFWALSEETGVPVIPFFLDGVAQQPEWMQADGLHPNAHAQPRMLENVWSTLAPLLDASLPVDKSGN